MSAMLPLVARVVPRLRCLSRRLRFPRVSIAVVVLVLCGALAPRAAAQDSLSRAASSPPTAKNGQLLLRNTSSDTVRIELRLGDATDCAQNPVATVKLVPPGKSWLIAALHPICWRRATGAASSTSATAWSPWHRLVLAVGERKEATF